MAKSTNRPWTEEEVELLQEYLNEGLIVKEISKILNHSEGSIYQKIYELRHSTYQNSDFKIKGKWSKEEIQLLKKYLDEGYTYREIALKLNRTFHGVEKKILKLSHKKSDLNSRKKWTKDEEELLIKYYNKGMKNKEIAVRLERSLPSISGKLNILLNNKGYHIVSEYNKNKNDESKKHATNHFKYWKKEEELRLKEYIENGYSYEVVAEILGRTLESVKHRYLYHIKEDKENG